MKTNPLKRVIGCILTITMLLALAACSQQAQQPSQTLDPGQETQTPDTSEKESTPESSQPEETEPSTNDTSGKTLVVYYSATGNTEAVAEYIASTLEADTFEIVPAEPYTSEDLDWTNKNSRVSREHDNESLQAVELVSATVENWEDYDTVFIGYPIWWHVAAWPVSSFVVSNDFTGKAVIPFCTSSSSGLGESGELLAEMAGTGDWLDGQRFRSSVSEADVVEWVNSLGITSKS